MLNKKQTNDCFIYVMCNTIHRKVGISKRPKTRVKQLSTGSSYPIELVYAEPLTKKNCLKIERSLHKTFEDKNENGEWFSATKEELIEEIEYILWEMEENGMI